MTTHTARNALATAALATIAALGLVPAHASAEEPTKKPPVTTTVKEPRPYLEVKLVDVLISGY